jgi:hypothetical protein
MYSQIQGTKNWWPWKTDGRLGQIALIGNVLQRNKNRVDTDDRQRQVTVRTYLTVKIHLNDRISYEFYTEFDLEEGLQLFYFVKACSTLQDNENNYWFYILTRSS